MQPQLTAADLTLLRDSLALFHRAGIALAEEIEPDDVEDAVADELVQFRAFPLATIATLHDPDGAPLLSGVVTSDSGPAYPTDEAGIVALVQRYAGAVGRDARDVAVVADPESGGRTGSVRVRFGEWDIADINYDFSDSAASGADGHTFELDVLAAALPIGAAAATFPAPSGADVTLLIPSEAAPEAADALIAAIEDEFVG